MSDLYINIKHAHIGNNRIPSLRRKAKESDSHGSHNFMVI